MSGVPPSVATTCPKGPVSCYILLQTSTVSTRSRHRCPRSAQAMFAKSDRRMHQLSYATQAQHAAACTLRSFIIKLQPQCHNINTYTSIAPPCLGGGP
eukprot:364421-Chlamydomonas_euryale.AAC.3